MKDSQGVSSGYFDHAFNYCPCDGETYSTPMHFTLQFNVDRWQSQQEAGGEADFSQSYLLLPEYSWPQPLLGEINSAQHRALSTSA
jgi:hypothetical protein